ncbi:hypothetical protein DFR67_105287 [Williamsia limnetica]|uniref:Uncharacterized protein n=1 Tax=Williamsia limnetica TaxID=882452 RepID=A0A318RP18_WILLI|nr:hypothetical protein [Williamsia limnetica]PYE18142.1 hypothetical protein DFR67_105287 [Williamsia limnetica]
MDRTVVGLCGPGYLDIAARLDQLCARLPDAAGLRSTVDDLHGPLRVAVTGRHGTGRDTLARAVRRVFDVSPIGPGDDDADADAWLYVLAGWPRPDDMDALSRLDPDRCQVILGKADTLGSWPAARVRACECAEKLGQPVLALMPLLAVADLGDPEVDLLTSLARAGEVVPPMQATFVDAGGPHQRLGRVGLLRTLDAYGIACVLALFVDGPIEAAELGAQLVGRSGLPALGEFLTGAAGSAGRLRLRRVADQLELVAASGLLRDDIEHLLAGSALAGAVR